MFYAIENTRSGVILWTGEADSEDAAWKALIDDIGADETPSADIRFNRLGNDQRHFWDLVRQRAIQLGATEEEAKAIADGGFTAADEADMIGKVDDWIDDELDLLREA